MNLQPPSASLLSGAVLELGPVVMCRNLGLCICFWCLTWQPWSLIGFLFLDECILFLYDEVTKIRQKCQNEQPRKVAMVPKSALKKKILLIAHSSEHNRLVPRSTIKGNQKYFSPWLFMNQPDFLFQTFKVTESNHVEPQKGDSLPISLPAHPFSLGLLELGFH